MNSSDDYDLRDFTPYLLSLAAETSGLAFQKIYRAKYGMLRTEWRVLFHLGRYGPMRAKNICDRARIHKTKVSRAVTALGTKRYLARQPDEDDRRQETLSLTRTGQQVFDDLYETARKFDAQMMSDFSADDQKVLRACLAKIAKV